METDDIDLCVWVKASESPLNSDGSGDGSPKGFGDLKIADNEYDNGDEPSVDDGLRFDPQDHSGGNRPDVIADKLLRRLEGRHEDFLSTVKARYRFSCLTELDVTEQCAVPAIIKSTNLSTSWPCEAIEDTWFKIKVYFAQKCKLPCCQELTWPQEWARRRRFCIPKKHYMAMAGMKLRETEAILRWSDLVSSHDWQEGNWNEKGVLIMSDSQIKTKKITWSIMEEHLAVLAYSNKIELVLLAARICMESLAKNKAMYTYSQQYWGFARICIDLLASPNKEVQEGILLSLQLYLRTLKIFHSCFSHKCSEYASAGLFPVLLDLLGKSSPHVQAVIVNIILLMIMHAPYISLLTNMGGLKTLMKLANTDHQLLQKRIHACLEIVAKHAPAQTRLVEEGVIFLAVTHMSSHCSPDIQLSCVFILNSLCTDHKNLKLALSVDNCAVIKAAMRILTDWTLQQTVPKTNLKSQSLSITQIQKWCTLPRQNLILLCKLCVEESACRQMIKRGLVLKLRGVWYNCDTETDRLLVIEALAIMSRFSRPAEKICQEGFLLAFTLTDVIAEKDYAEQILEIIHNMGHKYIHQMLEAGLLDQMILCFGEKGFSRRLYPMVTSILASFSSNDKVQSLLLQDSGKVYTLLLDTAFMTSDYSMLQSCICILSKLNTTVVPQHLLRANSLHLVAYIDKLLKTGPDGLVLHGLMQLQDLLKVHFLLSTFREHHIQKVIEVLCCPPYKPPVQFVAGQVLESLTGVRSRRSSIRDDRIDYDDCDSGLKDNKKNGDIEEKVEEKNDNDNRIQDTTDVSVDEDDDFEILSMDDHWVKL